MKPSSKEQELAELEARKQAILQGMGQDEERYPGEGYADHIDDRGASSRPLDANPYRDSSVGDFSQARTPAEGPRRTRANQPGLEIPLDDNPYGASEYPEQDSQSAEIASLQARLRALQGY